MKKIFAIALALLLIAAAVSAFGASAAGEKVTFTMENTGIDKDGNYTVKVNFANADNFYLTNGGFSVFYDTEAMELVGNASSWTKGGAIKLTMKKQDDGSLQATFADSYALKDEDDNLLKSGLLLTLTFKMKDGKEAGKVWMNVTKWEGGDAEDEDGLVLNNTNHADTAVAPTENAPFTVEKVAEATTAATTTAATTTASTTASTTKATVATTTKAPVTGVGSVAPIALISLVALAGAGIVAVSLKKK